MSEAKFVSLRKRLDQLGYRQSLSLDSLPLVEKLFGDLLHTTDSLKAAKQELSRRNEQKVRKLARPKAKNSVYAGAFKWLGHSHSEGRLICSYVLVCLHG
jgi:hypothetical protein